MVIVQTDRGMPMSFLSITVHTPWTIWEPWVTGRSHTFIIKYYIVLLQTVQNSIGYTARILLWIIYVYRGIHYFTVLTPEAECCLLYRPLYYTTHIWQNICTLKRRWAFIAGIQPVLRWLHIWLTSVWNRVIVSIRNGYNLKQLPLNGHVRSITSPLTPTHPHPTTLHRHFGSKTS